MERLLVLIVLISTLKLGLSAPRWKEGFGPKATLPLSLGLDANCPPHPYPVSLPHPLPDGIQNAFAQLAQDLKSSLNSTNLPGIAASIVYMGEEIWSQGFGVKSKSGQSEPPDHNTIFRIGSISKVFAALVMYQMYERGYVKSLDNPLTVYCPTFSMINIYNSSNITLRQMAAQMSGLPRETPCEELASSDTLNICPLTTQQILGRLKDEAFIFPPWTVPSYSNLAFALLGRCLVEHVFPETTYEEYVIKNILQPLEMTSTGFNITTSVIEKMATGYEPDGSVAPLYDLGWEGPAGQMYSTTADLNTLAHFFTSAAGENGGVLFHPEVLSADLRKEMELQVYVNRDQLTGFGTPWEIRFTANYTILRKGGNIDGYSALFSYIPDLKMGMNIMWSGSVDECDSINNVYNYIIPAFVSYLLTVQPPLPYPPNPEVYEGNYTYGTVEAVIKTENKQLILTTITSGSVVLAYKSQLRFQISFPDYIQPCLLGELSALRHEFVVFEPARESPVSPGFTIPGSFPGVQFKRKN